MVTEVPVETCHLTPTTVCRNTNKILPVIKPVPNCKDFSTQICSYGVSSGSVGRHRVTRWCYNDSNIGEDFTERSPSLVRLTDGRKEEKRGVRLSRWSQSYLPSPGGDRRGRQVGQSLGMI